MDSISGTMVSCSAFAPFVFLNFASLAPALCFPCRILLCLSPLSLLVSFLSPISCVFDLHVYSHTHLSFRLLLFPISCICNLHVCSNTHLSPISHLCLAASSLFPEYDIPVSATYSFQIFSFQIVGGTRSTLRTAPGACGFPGWRPWGGPGVG